MEMLGRRAAENEDQLAFAYPLHVMVLIGPLALLPLPLAQAVWLSLIEIGLLTFSFVAPRAIAWRPPFWLLALVTTFTVGFYSTVWAVILGQVAVLIGAVIALAWWSLRTGNWTAAGACLAVSTMKPQVSLLMVAGVLMWACLRRHWRLLASFGITLFFLLLLPTVWVPTWPFAWLRATLEYGSYTAFDPPLVTLTGSYWSTGLVAGILLAGVAYRWQSVPTAGEPSLDWGLGVFLVVGALTAPRTSHVNHLVLMLPLFFLLSRLSVTGVVAVALVLLAGPWIADAVLAPPRAGIQHAMWQHRHVAPIMPLGLALALTLAPSILSSPGRR
jgi:hypothetical protein